MAISLRLMSEKKAVSLLIMCICTCSRGLGVRKEKRRWPLYDRSKKKRRRIDRRISAAFYEKGAVERRIKKIAASSFSSRYEDTAGETACGSTKNKSNA